MATIPAGTLLTCAHGGCACRVRIEEACACTGADAGTYKCTCGADLVPVDE
jgi:metallothionein